jgi:hypothetical protein
MRLIIFTACVLFLAACKDDAAVPKDIIARDNMEKILWDIIRADQFSLQYMGKDTAKKIVKNETMKLYEEIFRIHHVSKDQFKKSFQYYADHPETTKIMFDTLSAYATRQRVEIFKKSSTLKPN